MIVEWGVVSTLFQDPHPSFGGVLTDLSRRHGRDG